MAKMSKKGGKRMAAGGVSTMEARSPGASGAAPVPMPRPNARGPAREPKPMPMPMPGMRGRGKPTNYPGIEGPGSGATAITLPRGRGVPPDFSNARPMPMPTPGGLGNISRGPRALPEVPGERASMPAREPGMRTALMKKGGAVKGKTYAKGGMVKGSGCVKKGIKKPKYS